MLFVVVTGVAAALSLAGGHRAVARPEPAGPTRARTAAAPTTPTTTVSLEFDHAFTDALPGVELANASGMKVTLFAMSGRVGLPTYMTVAQLQTLQAAGDEIGGHTIDHQDLSMLSPAAQRHEICDDRTALEGDGLNVIDFAYPYGHFDAATPGVVRSCGYESARGTGGLASQGGCYGACPNVETIPPADPFDTRTINSVLDTTSVASLEGYVTRAERAHGGWLQIVFHHVCDACDEYAITYPDLAQLIAWLVSQASQGVREETISQVLNTPFVAPALRLAIAPPRAARHDGAGRDRTTGSALTIRAAAVTLRAARRCPATPYDAPCVATTDHAAPAVRVGAGATLTVVTGLPATTVRMIGTGLRFHQAPGDPMRWRATLPHRFGTGGRTLTVTYTLGTAQYRWRAR